MGNPDANQNGCGMALLDAPGDWAAVRSTGRRYEKKAARAVFGTYYHSNQRTKLSEVDGIKKAALSRCSRTTVGTILTIRFKSVNGTNVPRSPEVVKPPGVADAELDRRQAPHQGVEYDRAEPFVLPIESEARFKIHDGDAAEVRLDLDAEPNKISLRFYTLVMRTASENVLDRAEPIFAP